MAKKTFNDLLGVRLTVTSNYNGITENNRLYMFRNETLNSIDYEGDIFYMIDNEHNFDIIPVVLKERIKNWSNTRIKYSKNLDDTKTFVPGTYDSDEKIFNKTNVLKHIRSFTYKGNRSHVGLFFTTEEEAKEWQEKIKAGKVFKMLKPGDIIYYVSSQSTKEKPRELKITNITKRNNDGQYEIHFGTDGHVTVGETIWEDKISEQIDQSFYNYSLKKEKGDFGVVRLFVNEKDALRAIAETANRRKKSATVKYIKSIENHDGKLIILKDNAGSDLHYGDTVVYIRRVGYNGHPELRKGTIVGETKTTITVLDEVEKQEGKPTGWRGERNEESAGKHFVRPQSVMLFKLAEVNKNSGYSFIKT